MTAEELIRLLPTSPPADCCTWCQEGRGWCNLAGGPNPCEGVDEYMAAMGDAAAAPTFSRPFPAGGAS